MAKYNKKRLRQLRSYLLGIDVLLNKVEQVDPYGDVIENFQEADKRTRHTRRIIAMIDKDLGEGKKHLEGDDDFWKERWIRAILTNDEASTDEELVTHFMKKGDLTRKEAEQWVAKRGAYLRGELT